MSGERGETMVIKLLLQSVGVGTNDPRRIGENP